MARPLWKELRAQRQRTAQAAAASGRPPPKPHFGLAIVSTLVAIAAIVLDSQFRALSTKGSWLRSHHMVWAGSMAAVFLIFGSIAVRRAARQVGRLVHAGGGPTAGEAIRLILTITGVLIVLIVTIGLLGVNATHLLAAAGVTGIILGLAAQQSLGNVFAGVVLMVARPFVIGERIRIRAGAFGGIFDGEVRAMGLTYVELQTEQDGLLRIPNLGVLNAAVGQAPEAQKDAHQKSLYVNRALPKRPPRAAESPPAQRPPARPTTRRPREVIRRLREQRAAAETEAAEPRAREESERDQKAPPVRPERRSSPRRRRPEAS